MMEEKILVVTGGTGSFGRTVVEQFSNKVQEIRVFSRDEKKQDDMRHYYQVTHPDVCRQIKFYIGDTRDANSMKRVMDGADIVFHAAALKQVPSCEFFPIEAAKTNIFGTYNVLNAAYDGGVKKTICLSTDKAAYPINAMGISKAMMEKVVMAFSKSIDPKRMSACCTRYGNVMCSRGSVIPLFVDQILTGNAITVTDPHMTRFMMSLDEAVQLVFYALEHAENGDLMVQKAPSCSIGDLATIIKEIFNSEVSIRHIGKRHGEKIHETLLTEEEYSHAIDLGKFFRVPTDGRDLNYDYAEQESEQAVMGGTYNSKNARQLTGLEIKEKLLSLPLVQEALKSTKDLG